MPAGALTSPADATGAAPVVDLPARQVLTPSLLATGTPTGPPGTVVAAVRLDDPAVAALLAPGTHVDLVAARPEGGAGDTVARRALVLPAPVPSPGGGDGLLPGGDDGGAPVLVAVTPEEAVRIAAASASARLVAVVVP
ncbi:hypothetical protein GC089_14435 [Cellulomonas sp. JZ18]|uniref:hypothetical protein n=1 Tax=Cellulomonas sp. JZ18 TaxID=2654191 RepID=UPI0012D44A70|nr:hypothetical protein [Cellulomonas sp. JZ18]QGQ20182.1 hypothetical protein GC089_14435 [Cellulomonas sp. JZ18]